MKYSTFFPVIVAALLLPALCVHAQGDRGRGAAGGAVSRNDSASARASIEALISALNYGVPNSPAFEIMPDKPSEITDLVTPRDIKANILNLFDGTKLRAGAAFDFRPITIIPSLAAGSLAEYQSSMVKQVLWRTVLSLGTAAASQKNSDILLSLGVRIPLIDQGDPRGNAAGINLVEQRFIQALSQQQPSFDETLDDAAKRIQNASVATQALRDSLRAANWNALKVDLGLAGMLRAKNGDLSADSLASDRAGLWLAAAFPITTYGQLTISGKGSWISTDTVTEESSRYVVGGIARFFIADWLSASVEGAGIWSSYADRPDSNEHWTHYALIAEIHVPKLGGWFGIGYGGDSDHRGDPKAKISLSYGLYTDQILKK
jgi:hypothetical protein